MNKRYNLKRSLVLLLTLCLLAGNLYQVYGKEENMDTESMADPEDDEYASGYIEMPWDRYVPEADESIPFETAKDRIVNDGSEEAAGDIPDVSVPSAYPYTWDSEASLRDYFNTELMPLRNQNPYGTCWAHSAISLIEGYMLSHGLSDKKGAVDKNVNYSELQLAYFYYHNNTNPMTGSDGGDTITVSPSQDKNVNRTGSFLDIGGNLGMAAQSLINRRGAADEADVPYANLSELISTDEGKKAVSGIDDSYASDYDVVHLKNEYQINLRLNPGLVKQAILADKLVGTSFYSRNDCYDSAHHSFCNLVNTNTNHAIAIVGWDDDFPKSNFNNVPDENGAWLIRNSWKYNNDDIYSYHGYFWLSYCDTSLSGTAYVYEAGTDQSDNSYYHVNQIHATGNWSMEKAANVYTVAGTAGAQCEKLDAVSFEISKADTPYTVSIYSVGNDGKPTNEKLTEDITGTFPYAGIYTIPIEDNVIINKGEKFAVAIEASAYSVVSEYKLASNQFSSTVDIHPGESFYGYSGRNGWYDLRDLLSNKDYLGSYGNYCINAYTSDASDCYSTSQFDFSASGGTYDKTAYTASVTPKSEIAGNTVTVYYKRTVQMIRGVRHRL